MANLAENKEENNLIEITPHLEARAKRETAGSRRVLRVGIAALAAAGVFIAYNQGGVNATEQIPDSGPHKLYIVKPHDTLWGIATEATEDDPRKLVYELKQQLPNDAAHAKDTLQAGDKLLLPASSSIGELMDENP